MSAAGQRIEQEGVAALTRWANGYGRLRLQNGAETPLSVVDIPSGEEFMLELRVLPMGKVDG